MVLSVAVAVVLVDKVLQLELVGPDDLLLLAVLGLDGGQLGLEIVDAAEQLALLQLQALLGQGGANQRLLELVSTAAAIGIIGQGRSRGRFRASISANVLKVKQTQTL